MLSRLKKKQKKKQMDIKHMIPIIILGIIVFAFIKFNQSNPFVGHK